MTGSEVLQRVETGYRMARPDQRFDCPDSLYDTICKCWNRQPEERPTFRHLYDFFDDFLVSVEPSYREHI